MELSYLLLTGSLSGLLSVLAHAVLWSIFATFRVPLPGAPVSSPLQISDALLHMLAGTGSALLFWLSWGLAAVVDVSWWVRGLSFAGLCWTAFALPSVLAVAIARAVPVPLATALAARWAMTYLIAGLACAWSWELSV
ncbi:MAG: hypothetical protein ACREUC_12515 [Steroidobacteraceae bacterium]